MNNGKAADHSDIRINNTRLIIEALRENGPLSRAMLAKKLKMSKPTVTANIENLLLQKIVFETGLSQAGKQGGRPAILIQFNSNYKFIIVIDLNYKYPFIALGNLSCEIISKEKIRIPKTIKVGERLAKASSAIRDIFRANNIDITMLAAIIISSPGVIDNTTGEIVSNPQFSLWTKIGLKSFLEKEFGKTVLLKNDTSLGVLGEATLGSGKFQKNFVYISCGLGLGAGLFLNGEIYEGTRFAAGEIACVINEKFGEGVCIEQQIANEFLIANVEKDIDSGEKTTLAQIYPKRRLTLSDLVLAYQNGDEYIRKIIYTNGKILGVAISNLASTLDLPLVAVGGGCLAFEEEFLRGIRKITSTIPFLSLSVVSSKLGFETGIYGGFVYVLKEMFNEIFNLE